MGTTQSVRFRQVTLSFAHQTKKYRTNQRYAVVYHHCVSFMHLRWWYTAFSWWYAHFVWWYAIAYAMDKKIQVRLDLHFLAEKQGFEPWLRFSRTTPLAGEPLRPLGYFSEYKFLLLSCCAPMLREYPEAGGRSRPEKKPVAFYQVKSRLVGPSASWVFLRIYNLLLSCYAHRIWVSSIIAL